MLGSINIPYNLLLDPETKALLPPDQLKKLFEMKGVDPSKPIICSGTSISAYVLETALNEAQFGSPDSRKVYDGSWRYVCPRGLPKLPLSLTTLQ
jgi:thiosulfate/3-mercaptopyruvate sulfurtransferase